MGLARVDGTVLRRYVVRVDGLTVGWRGWLRVGGFPAAGGTSGDAPSRGEAVDGTGFRRYVEAVVPKALKTGAFWLSLV